MSRCAGPRVRRPPSRRCRPPARTPRFGPWDLPRRQWRPLPAIGEIAAWKRRATNPPQSKPVPTLRLRIVHRSGSPRSSFGVKRPAEGDISSRLSPAWRRKRAALRLDSAMIPKVSRWSGRGGRLGWQSGGAGDRTGSGDRPNDPPRMVGTEGARQDRARVRAHGGGHCLHAAIAHRRGALRPPCRRDWARGGDIRSTRRPSGRGGAAAPRFRKRHGKGRCFAGTAPASPGAIPGKRRPDECAAPGVKD